MKRTLRNAGWGLLWLTFAASAFATPFTVNSQVQSIDGGGEFSVTLGSNPVQDLLAFCIDFNNYVAFGTQFDANVGTLPGDLPNTRYGTTAEAGFTYQDVPATSTEIGTALDRYTMAGWLITQYSLPTTVFNAQQDWAIQNAIWNFLDATGAQNNDPNPALVATWMGNAVAWETALKANPAALLAFQNTITVITASDIAGVATPDRYSADHYTDQEMMIVNTSTVPEPGSMALASIGGALLFVGLLRRRRNS